MTNWKGKRKGASGNGHLGTVTANDLMTSLHGCQTRITPWAGRPRELAVVARVPGSQACKGATVPRGSSLQAATRLGCAGDPRVQSFPDPFCPHLQQRSVGHCLN